MRQGHNRLTCCFLREKFLQIWSAFSREMYTLDAWEVLPLLELRLQNKSLPMKTGRFLRRYYESFISVYWFIMTYEFVFTSCTTNGFVFSNLICFYKFKLQYIVLFCFVIFLESNIRHENHCWPSSNTTTKTKKYLHINGIHIGRLHFKWVKIF